MTQTIRYYLAGPITKPDWRHNSDIGAREIEPHDWSRTNRRDVEHPMDGSEEDVEHILRDLDHYPELDDGLHKGVRMIRTGPWCVGCDHGCFHGHGSHGAVLQWGDDLESERCRVGRSAVLRLSLDAIDRSDVVVAWLDNVSRTGTIAEIGYARGAGKQLALFIHPGALDAWFAIHLVQDIGLPRSVLVSGRPPSIAEAMEAALIACGRLVNVAGSKR